jgi:hypothetical protein
MAILTPGTGGTIKSVTLENAFHELLSRIATLEQDTSKNSTAATKITMSVDVRSGRVTGNFSFGLTKETTATGSTSFVVVEHLSNSGYAQGTNGTIKSAGINASLVEVCEMIQTKEQLASKNPTGLNTITGLNYDSETLLITGNFDYNVTGSIDNLGSLVLAAKTYLVD